MNEDDTQAFWIVSFEALYHEFHWCIILYIIVSSSIPGVHYQTYHVGHRETGHVKNYTLDIPLLVIF